MPQQQSIVSDVPVTFEGVPTPQERQFAPGVDEGPLHHDDADEVLVHSAQRSPVLEKMQIPPTRFKERLVMRPGGRRGGKGGGSYHR